MKKFLLVAALAFSASGVSAATTNMFRSTPSTPFGMSSNETRETIFDVNFEVTLTELGAHINPFDDATYRWNIFTSNASASEISQVFTTDFFAARGALSIVDTAVNVTLGVGTYILQLEALGTGAFMQRYNERNVNLPFDIADGAITVIDGSANNNAGNIILPAFSITLGDPTPIPLPASGVLLLAGIAGMAGLRRSRRKG
ncbi:MAG: VPLPA-CTERM sorting domain-containing protein [Pseudomonadota bacterium]